MSTEVIEMCPHCMKENDFIWDTEADGLQAYCLHCGERLMLCSECPKYNNGCDYSIETNSCSKVVRHGRGKGATIMKPFKKSSQNKRKYIRKCGVCDKRYEQSEMVRTNNSPNGWICRECLHNQHPEYEIEFPD